MKTRERIAKIRAASKNWSERLELAKDHRPGTEFDWLIPHLLSSLRMVEDPATSQMVMDLSVGMLRGYGEDLVRAIRDGKSDLFRRWAIAIDQWHAHKPQEDGMRTEIHLFCIPPKAGFDIRAIEAHLAAKKVIHLDPVTHEAEPSVRKQIYRICDQDGIVVNSPKGRRKNRDTKSKKKPH